MIAHLATVPFAGSEKISMTILTRLVGKSASWFTSSKSAIGGLGEVVNYSGIRRWWKATDSTALDKIIEQNLLLTEALGNMTHGLCLFDSDNRLQLWNDRFTDMYRVQGKLRVGQTLAEILKVREQAGTLVEKRGRIPAPCHAGRQQRRDLPAYFSTAGWPDYLSIQ